MNETVELPASKRAKNDVSTLIKGWIDCEMMPATRWRAVSLIRTLWRILILGVGVFAITACTTTSTGASSGVGVWQKKDARQIPSENYNGRVSSVIIHFTTANFEDSLNILTKASSNSVSSHYLVPDPSDETYSKKKLEVYQLVPESERAWHAGRSYWAGKSALNDHSIGIEVVNQTYCVKHGGGQDTSDNMPGKTKRPKRMCFYPDFPESQMEILIDLLRGIQKRHPRVGPTHYIGHSDIAPSRKIDPGPRFPWERLYQLGIGAWFDDATVTKYWEQFSARPMPLINVQKALHAYGYQIEPTGVLDEQTRNVISAFQMHFRPMEVTGKPSLETTAILYALIEKYRAKHLEELLRIGIR